MNFSRNAFHFDISTHEAIIRQSRIQLIKQTGNINSYKGKSLKFSIAFHLYVFNNHISIQIL
uniref:Uncharacterized protein n=1 Tax=Ascaris lumbricoides TaxID=6252 RepID=A0A0M3I9N3_ASCLU